MPERWLGVLVSSEKVVAVDVTVDGKNALEVKADETWTLQKGDRAEAYAVMSKRLAGYLKDNKIDFVIFKESAVSLGGTKKSHLHAAELRGALMCSAALNTKTETLSKAHITKTFGDRKVDEYVRDDKFWEGLAGKALRSGSREAGMILLAAQKARFKK